MIIRENGIVVGLIDNDSFELEDSESKKLTDLVDDLVGNGIEAMVPAEERDDVVSGDGVSTIQKDHPVFLDALHNRLLFAGFEVQIE